MLLSWRVLKPGEKYSQTTIYKFLPANLPS